MLRLHPYQITHADHIEKSLRHWRVALDASDPGTGKTYVACAVAARMNCPVVIVTTKATVPSWSEVASGFGLNPLLVSNYETVRMGKLPQCRKVEKNFVWEIPQETLVIFDECQKCKGRSSLNAHLLIAARKQHLRVLLCSATAASDPLQMRAIGFALGLHTLINFWSWAQRNGVTETAFGMQFTGGEDCLRSLHRQIFPAKGSRLRIADIPNFPTSVISTSIIETGQAKAIQRVYDQLRKELRQAEKADNREALSDIAEQLQARRASVMTIMLRARQAIELYKVSAMAEMALNAVEEGLSVVLLVNFTETMQALCQRLNCPYTIKGGQSAEERQNVIDMFQRNEISIVIANIQAGGVGVSLHDPSGKRSRLSIISPTFSATDMRQALGRVHRSGGAASIQKICFAAGTCEEHTAALCAEKLANIDLLNDGDLQPFPLI